MSITLFIQIVIVSLLLTWLIVYLKNHIDLSWRCVNCGKGLKGKDKKNHRC